MSWVSIVGLVLSVTAVETPAVEVIRDQPYVAGGTADQRLDFHWPAGAESAVLFIHGGSLVEVGERRTSEAYRDVCRPLVAAGYGCATIDYRLAPTHKWPAMPRDVAAAVLAVRELVRARGGEPDRLVLFGHSSGCQLAAVVSLDPSHLHSVGLTAANLGGVIAMGCVLDRWDAALRRVTAEQIRTRFVADPQETERYASAEDLLAANPSFHIGPHSPPFLVLIAEEERFAPPILEQGARFVRRLQEARVPADLAVVPGTHMSSISELDDPGSAALTAVLAFLREPRGPSSRRQ